MILDGEESSEKEGSALMTGSAARIYCATTEDFLLGTLFESMSDHQRPDATFAAVTSMWHAETPAIVVQTLPQH